MIDTQLIISKLKPLDPEKIILFGSRVNNKAERESDVDVFIIKKTSKKPSERIAEALKLVWGSEPHIEPFVFTPQEFRQAIADNRFFITQEVLAHGKTIYEKK